MNWIILVTPTAKNELRSKVKINVRGLYIIGSLIVFIFPVCTPPDFKTVLKTFVSRQDNLKTTYPGEVDASLQNYRTDFFLHWNGMFPGTCYSVAG